MIRRSRLRLRLLVLCAVLAACTNSPMPPTRTPETERMIERLEQIAASADPRRNPYANSVRVDSMRAAPPPPDTRTRLVFDYAFSEQLLYAGRLDEAIQRLELLMGDAAFSYASRDFSRMAEHLLAIAYLRLGERENCLGDRGTPACLAPVPPEGVHTRTQPAQTAVDRYAAILAREPDNLGARWLLNLGYMMLGAHPDGVPVEWLIAPQALASGYDIKRFPDIAPRAGLDALGNVGGSVVDDLDGDGYLDVMVSSWGLRDQLRFFLSNGDGTFADHTIAAGLEGIVGGGNLVHADYDNDGDLDVFVLRGGWLVDGYPNSLLRNRGNGTFDDVTESAGLLEPHPTQTACWGDYDNDGYVDLFVGNESRDGVSHASQLFHNNGDGTFTDVAPAANALVAGFVKGAVWGDVDNDGRLDLYLSRFRETNVLLHNEGPNAAGDWTFTNRSHAAGVTEPMHSFPTWFWDYDNDGWTDLFVAGYRSPFGDVAAEYLGLPHQSEVPRVFRNNGDGTFTDVAPLLHLNKIIFAMGANFGDLDNDGWLDLYAGTGDAYFQALIPNRMFRNASGTVFQDVTTAGGFGHVGKGHGVSFADIDNDGDQDVHAVVGGANEGDLYRNVLFENPGHGNAWITLRLIGVRSNRAAIGARIQVTAETAKGPRDIHRTVSSGGSFGANSLQQEIGLGQATAIRTLAVTWPATGRTDRYHDVAVNRIYAIREGDAAPTAVAARPQPLSPDSH